MEELYRKFEEVAMGENPLEVAGIMMAQALKIYKLVLSEEEFEEMTNHITQSARDINVKKPTLN